MESELKALKAKLEGDLFSDISTRSIYATDASVYRKLPLAVVKPKTEKDIQELIAFANKNKIGLIPRAAGTSLGGQCVGEGIVVDTSMYFSKILEVNKEKEWVKVQPGVIRDELNQHLNSQGLFFGPNTSTANRAMIGGMTGNNSSGSYSIVYGTTREHVIEITGYLSDGSKVTFGPCDEATLQKKLNQDDLEGKIYRTLHSILDSPKNQKEIQKEYPDPAIHRRNTGYALDMMLRKQPFKPDADLFNICQLLCGSEGTLMLITEIKLNLVPLPPKHTALICAHYKELMKALEAVVNIMPFQPRALELMDKFIMDCTKQNIEQRKNRFFIEGDPEAILIIELGGATEEVLNEKIEKLKKALKKDGKAYALPVVKGKKTKSVWTLRKAGLGLLSNIKGDAKPVAVIEDTAVDYNVLPEYIAAFTQMMKQFDQKAVYYAHAGAGELHLRPILNLKDPADRKDFRKIAEETAKLVKKYNGALSGEHGDGRVRAEFIPQMIGQHNYDLLRQIKTCWDPNNIFNRGKITDAYPMDEDFRYESGQEVPEYKTKFEFSDAGGFVRAAEKCNGSGDCRKLASAGGTMCPSYMATKDEKDTTRARANLLREMIGNNEAEKNAFNQPEVKAILDLCLSCKGCSSECPSNVDMAKLKSEFLYQYRKSNGATFRDWATARISLFNKVGSYVPTIANLSLTAPGVSTILKKIMGIHPSRNLPRINSISLYSFYKKYTQETPTPGFHSKIALFADEFTNYNDVPIGITAIKLLNKLGFKVEIPEPIASGRAYFSKGYLDEAEKCAVKNVDVFENFTSRNIPVIGIEPSAILTFKDEYPELLRGEMQDKAKKVAESCFLIDDFLAKKWKEQKFSSALFSKEPKKIVLHGHCHQKSLNGLEGTEKMLQIPENYAVEVLPTGCCGMAGSFGYEENHYELSMKIGDLALFPRIERLDHDTSIAAGGTSCRHQIFDGTGKQALHPLEILFEALL